MNRAECIFRLVSCVFIALSGAFHSSCCGNQPGKAHYRTRKEEHFYILEEFLLSHGKSFWFFIRATVEVWYCFTLQRILSRHCAQQYSVAVSKTEGRICLRASGEWAGECVSVCVCVLKDRGWTGCVSSFQIQRSCGRTMTGANQMTVTRSLCVCGCVGWLWDFLLSFRLAGR